MNRTISFGDLLTSTFEEISASRSIVLVFLAIAVPIDTAAGLFEGSGDFSLFGVPISLTAPFGDLGGGLVGALVALGSFVVGVLITYWFYAALLARQPAPGFGRFWAFVLVYVLSILGIVLATLALVIPGIIVAVRWVPLIPVLLARDEPAMDSFGTSWQMTSGSSWPIFGVAVVLIAIGLIVSVLLDLASAATGGPGSIGAVFFDAAGEDVMVVLFTAFAVATFRGLADEGEEVAAVFE
ncbi:hypothetical protein [Erythrobacter sp.]|uniref:hypothetical protein n=1 Tax=Erythrobacter sp. TaxID=1042 RepID=UPI001425EF05|nr:hypothetical protein [Erythrobacter sp.]QIQ86308.1 MAG: hypothetical protein G9473_06125 [Erythrobacter sp.]